MDMFTSAQLGLYTSTYSGLFGTAQHSFQGFPLGHSTFPFFFFFLVHTPQGFQVIRGYPKCDINREHAMAGQCRYSMSHDSISLQKSKPPFFKHSNEGESCSKNNTVVPESDKNPQTEQQLYHCLEVLFCCGVRVAYK